MKGEVVVVGGCSLPCVVTLRCTGKFSRLEVNGRRVYVDFRELVRVLRLIGLPHRVRLFVSGKLLCQYE